MSQYQAIEDGCKNEVQSNIAIFEKIRTCWSTARRRHLASHRCVASKAAVLMLLWSFLMSLVYNLPYQLIHVLHFEIEKEVHSKFVLLGFYTFLASIYIFSPLAGFLADNKFGRYKIVVASIYAVLIALIVAMVIICVLTLRHILPDVVKMWKLLGVPIFVVFVAFACFSANVIQFGMDQLHDSPAGDHQSLFIHWYVWAWYLGILIAQIDPSFYYGRQGDYFFITTFFSTVVALIITLCLAHCKLEWFFIDSARLNPYKLVYRVTQFARQHKVPVQRSAFTYCEDEIPSGLDLGKAKYGGPFTTEQVEDVKAFYGILKVLFSLAFVFSLEIANNLGTYVSTTSKYYFYFNSHIVKYPTIIMLFLLDYGLLISLLIIVCIPVYVFFVRPYILDYVPGMLKRVGIGMILMMISLVCISVIDYLVNFKERENSVCTFHDFTFDYSNSTEILIRDSTLLVVHRSLTALSTMLIYIALYEFICSQSPHSMKGLLIGLSFALRGLFQLIAVIMISPLIYLGNHLPNCRMLYYILNICIGLIAVVVFIRIARKYKLRERDEPYLIYRYAEEYYSRVE